MLNKLSIATKSFREKFGTINGLILWATLLKEKFLQKGDLFNVRVPGIKFPIKLRAKTSDIEAFCQIFIHGELDIAINHPVEYIIDAGANIGLSSIYFANKHPNALIYALEVDKNNINVLQINTFKYKTINIIESGLWGHHAKLYISNPNAESWAFRVEEANNENPNSFSATTIDEIMASRKIGRIDILKIDIEGSEKEVFESNTSWLENVRTLFIELHDRIKPGCSDAVFKACSHKNYNKSVSGEYVIFDFYSMP